MGEKRGSTPTSAAGLLLTLPKQQQRGRCGTSSATRRRLPPPFPLYTMRSSSRAYASVWLMSGIAGMSLLVSASDSTVLKRITPSTTFHPRCGGTRGERRAAPQGPPAGRRARAAAASRGLRACWQNAAVCWALSSLRSFCASARVSCLYAFSLQLPISSLRARVPGEEARAGVQARELCAWVAPQRERMRGSVAGAPLQAAPDSLHQVLHERPVQRVRRPRARVQDLARFKATKAGVSGAS